MKDDRGRLLGRTLDRWRALDTDWQGVLVAVAIATVICLPRLDVPW